jgi:hypothetical protein
MRGGGPGTYANLQSIRRYLPICAERIRMMSVWIDPHAFATTKWRNAKPPIRSIRQERVDHCRRAARRTDAFLRLWPSMRRARLLQSLLPFALRPRLPRWAITDDLALDDGKPAFGRPDFGVPIGRRPIGSRP